MQILTFSTLYPNAAQPHHGIFVENRLRHFLKRHRADCEIIAPVPFFPFKASIFGSYAAFAQAPRVEERHGLKVHHPRYAVLPKIGMQLAPTSLERASLAYLKRRMAQGLKVDLIDAHYLYPDGVAAHRLAMRLGVPFVLTARGSDVTELPNYPGPRRQILAAVEAAAGVVTVCEALRQDLIALGADASKIVTLRNGVDLALFSPGDRPSLRARFNLTRRTLLSVGHLIERKGHHLVIDALSSLPETDLLIAGEGPWSGLLEERAKSGGVRDRVRFLGAVPHGRLAELYSAADALVLASSREGWANVLLEALACGTPVIATNVSGTGEVIRADEAGVLMKERSADAIMHAVHTLFKRLPQRALTRSYAEQFSWDETSDGLYHLFQRVQRGSP